MTASVHASLLIGFVAAAGLLAAVSRPDRTALVPVSSLGEVVVGVLVLLTPWQRLGRFWIYYLSVIVLCVVGVSTWAADDRALLTAPGYVLFFAWLGLHQSARGVLLAVPVALAVYLSALSAAGVDREAAGSAFPLIPMAGLLGLLIWQTVSRLRTAEAELMSDERWRAAMMATLAHDVRSPLTSIIGTLEVISDDRAVPDAYRPLMASAIRQAERINRLATGLLEVERVQQGRLHLDRTNVDLADLAGDIVDLFSSNDIVVDVSPSLSVWADRERLEQVLVNLVANALRHGLEPVEIRAEVEGAGVSLHVLDCGKGIPPAEVAKIFDRLSHSRTAGSVGLGLWIVRLLVEAHDGRVGYESSGRGAHFVVWLPARRAPETTGHSSRGSVALTSPDR